MTRTMQSVWQALTNTVIPAAKLLIDGRWRTPSDGATMVSVNPAIGAEITRILCGTAADIAQLAAVVPRRLGKGVWKLTVQGRKNCMGALSENNQTKSVWFALCG